jgi:hypothetical protein
MTNSHDVLKRMILIAVADDYEDFEMIVNEIADWTRNDNDAPDISQIEHELIKSIEDKDIKAYEPSETTNQLRAVHADPQKIRTLWFYITEKGLTRLEGLGGGWPDVKSVPNQQK